MEVVRSPEGLFPFFGGVLVPTMGALHAGHVGLIRRAHEFGVGVVVSIFVNPAQFNDAGDLARYPRDPEGDLGICAEEGVDAVFMPSVEAIYPEGVGGGFEGVLPAVATEPGLEDAHRPGHFAGVCRVCRRLFELCAPSRAVFGEKDWQQLQVVRSMVELERIPVSIEASETVRDANGLAMSSRNRRLSEAERERAGVIRRALAWAEVSGGIESASARGRAMIEGAGLGVEYFVVRDAATLMEPRGGAARRALAAVWAGDVRLIDNCAV